ncbi:MAG TPA: LamG domain-containing protein, partial [Armatimonadetes bacterium]|nr:LamG domain-containing protein [Armatimonadota bacterium]
MHDGAKLSNGLLDLTRGYAVLPEGQKLFGERAVRGSIAFWVRPEFDIMAVPFAMLFYCMQTDGNLFPDGYDEIGIYVDHGELCAKVAGRQSTMPFVRLRADKFLSRNRWTHIAITWHPDAREFYVDGKLIVRHIAPYDPPRLDSFHAELGRHPSSRRWHAHGIYAHVMLFDDVLSANEIATLAQHKPTPLERGVSPPPNILAEVNWKRIWLGRNAVECRLVNPTGKPLRTYLQLELAMGEPLKRRVVAEAPLTLHPGATMHHMLTYEIATDGAVQVTLLCVDASSGKLLSGRMHRAFIPQLLSNIVRCERTLKLLSQRKPPKDIAKRIASAMQHLSQFRKRFLTPPPFDREEFQRHVAKLRTDFDTLSQAIHRIESDVRIATAVPNAPFVLGWLHGTQKVLLHDAFPGEIERPIRIAAARNGYEPAQLFVFARTRTLRNVKVRLSPLVGGNFTIGREHLSWRVVGYVRTRKPVYKVRHVGLWPDPLFKCDEFEVPAGEHRIVWLTVYVPKSAPAGEYRGTVTVMCSEGMRALPIYLRVWNFTLPDRSSLPTAFGLNSCGHFQANMDVEKYVRNAAAHRVSLGFPGILWKGAKVQRPAFDWSDYDELVLTCALRTKVAKSLGRNDSPSQVNRATRHQRIWNALHLVCETDDGRRATYRITIAKSPQRIRVRLREPRIFCKVRFEWRDIGPATIRISQMQLRSASGETRTFDEFTHPQWWKAVGRDARVDVEGGQLIITVSAPTSEEPYHQWHGAVRSAMWSRADRDWKIDFTEFDAVVEKYYPWAVNLILVP